MEKKMFFENHIVRQFDEELDSIRKGMMEMAGKVEQQLHNAMLSITDADSNLAKEVIQGDSEIDVMELNIDKACVLLLAKRQPAARDLRLVVGITRAVKDLERIGDEACKIAAHSVELAELGLTFSAFSDVNNLANSIIAMLNRSLDAFARFDHKSARLAMNYSSYELDSKKIIEGLGDYMMANPESISEMINILWVVRSLERVGDHAQNLCEQIVFVVEGEDIRHS